MQKECESLIKGEEPDFTPRQANNFAGVLTKKQFAGRSELLTSLHTSVGTAKPRTSVTLKQREGCHREVTK